MHTVADVHTANVSMPQLSPVDGRPSCMFSLCMHPAILMPKHKKITFVSQGAHWRTDAHNGMQKDLWSVQTAAVFRVDIVCLRAFYAVGASAASAFLAERNDYEYDHCNR